ncbi:MAG: hypothetical protein H6648_03115 [Caldilineae bacterium]|nr:hypothetical protein [Caldilineae bacterium]
MESQVLSDFEVEALLDRHATLLRRHEAERAASLALGCEPALAQLLTLAERVQDALVPVTPAAQFRRQLGASLEAEAAHRIGGSALAPHAAVRGLAGRALTALRRNPARSLAGGSAALALVGVTALLLRERSGHTATGSGS